MTDFRRGDLVRVTDRKHPHVVKFARVWRVAQSWLEFVPGEYGARKRDCELVASRDVPEVGFVALPEQWLQELWHLAEANNADAAGLLRQELDRIRAARDERDAC